MSPAIKVIVLRGLTVMAILVASAWFLVFQGPILLSQIAEGNNNSPVETPSANPSSAVWTFDSKFDIPRHVLTSYYEALSAKQFKTAYSLWDQNGASSGFSTVEAYSERFKTLESAEIVFSGSGEMGEAEQYRYFKQPITIRTYYSDSTNSKTFDAEYTLRQPVENSTDQSWRIYNVIYTQVE